jgi:PAP2 superfamily
MVLLEQSLNTAQAFILRLSRALPAAIRRHALLLAIIFVYWIAGLIVGRVAHIPGEATVTTYLSAYLRLVPLMIACLVVGRGFQIVVFERPRLPLSQLLSEFRTTLATPERLAHALPLLLGMLIFGGTFTVVKTSIPSLASYSWDVTFDTWDRWLHGGFAPWQIIQPIIGFPVITAAIDWVYNSWFSILSLVWVWQVFSQHNERLRQQFFLTLMLGWILLGNIGAIVFASAGPCYYGRITGAADPYSPLMDYLMATNQSYPIWALTAQGVLWDNFALGGLTLGAGISAMPSMHVAIATLFALLCWRTNRWAGILMTVYAVLIMIGSVHLGWHYAVDGYIGALGTIVIWWIVGRLLARRAEAAPTIAVTDPA